MGTCQNVGLILYHRTNAIGGQCALPDDCYFSWATGLAVGLLATPMIC